MIRTGGKGLIRIGSVLFVMGFLVLGCAVSPIRFPTVLSEPEGVNYMSQLDRTDPQQKLYRQYVYRARYLQFDRIEDDVIYGWIVCTDCSWSRYKIVAVYDGSYLYTVIGYHEDFFYNKPRENYVMAPSSVQPQVRRWQWEDWLSRYTDFYYVKKHSGSINGSQVTHLAYWNAISKWRIEGRNIVKVSEIRKCPGASPEIQEWNSHPWLQNEGDVLRADCLENGAPFTITWVAITDDVLAGTKDTIAE